MYIVLIIRIILIILMILIILIILLIFIMLLFLLFLTGTIIAQEFGTMALFAGWGPMARWAR